jgi:hypothetical protein
MTTRRDFLAVMGAALPLYSAPRPRFAPFRLHISYYDSWELSSFSGFETTKLPGPVLQQTSALVISSADRLGIAFNFDTPVYRIDFIDAASIADSFLSAVEISIAEHNVVPGQVVLVNAIWPDSFNYAPDDRVILIGRFSFLQVDRLDSLDIFRYGAWLEDLELLTSPRSCPLPQEHRSRSFLLGLPPIGSRRILV